MTPDHSRSHSTPRRLAVALALLVLAAGTKSAAAQSGTRERVLDVVRAGDPGVRAARAAGDAGRAQAAQQWAALSPHVTLAAGFTRSDDPAMLFSQKLWQGRFTAADFAIGRLNQPAPQSALQWGINVDQPLWNGGRELFAPGLAAHYHRAASGGERAAVAGQLLSAVETYIGAVRAREDARAAEAGLAAATAMGDAAAGLYRMGQVPELDTLRAVAREAETRVRSIGAQRGLAVALDRLSRLVGEPVGADALAAPDAPPAPSGEGLARGELVAAREGAAAASAESRIAAMRLLPSLNSRAALTAYRPYADGAFERRWMVGVFAELPVFDGAQRFNEWRAAKARAAAATAGARALERDLAVGLAAARVEDAVARERRDAARAGRSAAEEALRLASMRYRSGLLPLTELLATDAEATAARAAEVEASASVTIAHYRLLQALGELR